MPASKVACPHCHSGLKSERPVLPGTRLKCPRCGTTFLVPGTVPPAVATAVPRERTAISERPPAPAVPARASNGQVFPAVASPPARPGGRRQALAWLLVGLGGLALTGLAAVLVAFCFVPGTPEPGTTMVTVGAGSEPPAPGAVPPVVPKPAPPPLIVLSAEEQRNVDEALARGIGFLKAAQNANGGWPGEANYAVGPSAMAALTLVECGVPVDDPCITKATAFIREACPNLSKTYEISLALLFLNRLGDGADRDRIQQLALRLVAGQKANGGWTYGCPVLWPVVQERLLGLLRELNTSDPEGLRRAQAAALSGPLPPALKGLAVLQDLTNRPDVFFRQGATDNSNTQFATLALWTARGHDLPLDRTLALIARHFRASQNFNGSWNYSPANASASLQGKPTMTCAGLLGLAVGHGLAAENRKPGERPEPDAAIQSALQVVSRNLSEAPRPGLKGKKKGPAALPMPDMYFLWSVERVAVLFHLRTIGDREWYPWGMEQLLSRQRPDGGWPAGGSHGANRNVNTCFAMLFLKRVNLAKDLTDKLLEGIVAPVAAAAPPSPAKW